MECLSIAMVSDFYLPDLGGVELQIKQLAKYLKTKGHRVIVITHCRPEHYGIMEIQGIKTYYLSWAYSNAGTIYPTFVMQYNEAKEIFTRESINIVHVHQSSSILGASYGIYAYHLGLKIVQTEHSLFNIQTNTYLHFNWVISTTYKLYSKFICVSRAVRNNMILRSYINSAKTVVIPNAVLSNSTQFVRPFNKKVRIVIIGRLVFRRGTDLLIKLLPQFCSRNKGRFTMDIIGDGPKMAILKLIIDKHGLSQMIILHGSLQNNKALQIMRQCDIFLSTALTQSFGVALVQAAHLNLQCVSTNVGGVCQILPSDRLHTVDVTPNSIIIKLQQLMTRFQLQKHQKKEPSRQIYYKAQDCFERVIQVYNQVVLQKSESKKWVIAKDLLVKGSLPAILLIIIFGILNLIDLLSQSHHFLKRKLKFQ